MQQEMLDDLGSYKLKLLMKICELNIGLDLMAKQKPLSEQQEFIKRKVVELTKIVQEKYPETPDYVSEPSTLTGLDFNATNSDNIKWAMWYFRGPKTLEDLAYPVQLMLAVYKRAVR